MTCDSCKQNEASCWVEPNEIAVFKDISTSRSLKSKPAMTHEQREGWTPLCRECFTKMIEIVGLGEDFKS
jgi:hypothetical protein